ncbi:hypothetical protein B0H19DRAFT_1316444 [Mycena capillaripes]|nr:hypothetical protein B0H19DRAFT_1316444 [Mycena capillaripes]
MDFGKCKLKPEWAGSFDKFLSIEMFDHVGKEFFTEFWAVAHWTLKSDTSVRVVLGITIVEARVPSYDRTNVDFVQKWVRHRSSLLTDLPGGYLPSFIFLVQTLNEGSTGRLFVDSVLNVGPHYARTLREWKRRFLAKWDSVVGKALIEHYNLDTNRLDIFKRN